MTTSRKKFFSWIVLIIFSLVIFSSSCFIILHSNHVCTSEECSVCTELAECHKILNTLGTSVMGGVHLSFTMFTVCAVLNLLTSCKSYHTTLISLKVELLN
ncbi:MAG: hypothetical protein IKW96_09505 [Ruminococcus sp.]|uniref:hypothetical protein n=1 Tax=Ruminococcus sp. TaxID=41978 RepID=UPI0025F6861D|nr:hypothetical protein [Ruminococcus sp.]MBR5683487.1 hypothetical protein [Ruminococcus sp.]